MKTLKYLQILAGATLVGFVGTGCVHERVTYVTQVPPQSPPPPAPQPPPAPAPIIRSAAELDNMTGPIALYPDPLIAQLLPAATVPDQVAAANNFLRTGGDVLQVEYQPWEPSVKALTRYPDVVRMMGANLPWTTDLGIAFINQEHDVMDSIQRLRLQAHTLGNLRSCPEQRVVVEERIIQIVPVTPEVIFVPVYRPEIVFLRPPPLVGFHVVFGAGHPVGPWLNHDLNWHDHQVIVWHPDHPRPHDWWEQPPSRQQQTIIVNNTTIVNNYTVWQAPKKPAVVAREQVTRPGPMTPAPNRLPAKPQHQVVREAQASTDVVRESQTTTSHRTVTNNPTRTSERPPTVTRKPAVTHKPINATANAHVDSATTVPRPAPEVATTAPRETPTSTGHPSNAHVDPSLQPVPAHELEHSGNPHAETAGHANKPTAHPDNKGQHKGQAKAEAKGHDKKPAEHNAEPQAGTNAVDHTR